MDRASTDSKRNHPQPQKLKYLKNKLRTHEQRPKATTLNAYEQSYRLPMKGTRDVIRKAYADSMFEIPNRPEYESNSYSIRLRQPTPPKTVWTIPHERTVFILEDILVGTNRLALLGQCFSVSRLPRLLQPSRKSLTNSHDYT